MNLETKINPNPEVFRPTKVRRHLRCCACCRSAGHGVGGRPQRVLSWSYRPNGGRGGGGSRAGDRNSHAHARVAHWSASHDPLRSLGGQFSGARPRYPLTCQRGACLQEARALTADEAREDVTDPVDQQEIFELLRDISDPEHPHS